MRTWLAPHIQRALGLGLVGILAASATAQVFDTFPQQFDTLPQQTGEQTEELLIEPTEEDLVEPEMTAPPVFVRPPAPITVMRAPPMPAAAQPAPSVTTAPASPAVALAPIVHTLSFPAPALHLLDVQSAIPTDGRDSIDLMMAVWTPGFYRIEDYARDVQNFTARSLSGEALSVEKPAPNRWRIDTQGEPTVIISYRLLCERNGSVSRSIVSEEYAVICGGPTYMTLVDQLDRPHEVHINMPSRWGKSATGLPIAPDSRAHHYRARDYDTLIDSPIAVGNLSTHEFRVAGVRHFLVDIGNASDREHWNGAAKAADLAKMVQETYDFWGFLPFENYYFLNKIGSARGGGLEHLNSTLIHTSTPRPVERANTRLRWLQFVAHEYFHAFNVKRLRPVELGPFDYENARRTSGLWVAEGLTNYFNSLLVVRSGLCSTQEYLAALSAHIGQLQRAPGRLQQSLAASSLDTWTGSGFGRGASATSISYYTKGPVVGLLLDAKIRRATNGQRSLDDVMRLAYSRYAGEVGYTEQQFLDTCSEVAGVDLNEFFDKALFSTEELDYSEALDWFGLRFRPSEDESEDEAQPSWRLEMLPDATDEQRLRMVAYLAPSRAPINVAAVAAAAAASAGDAAPAGGAAPADDVMPAGAQGLPAPLVDGIGGVFIYSNDAPRLAAWYEQQLGFRGTKIEEDGAFIFAFKHRPLDSPDTVTETVWAILPAVEPRASDPPQYSINYRVGSMERVLDHLRAGGVTIENAVDYPYGRFAWIRDPDGNRVELFEKPKP